MTNKLGPKRVTIPLTKQDVERLNKIIEINGISQNEAIRRALATEAFVQENLKAGKALLMEDPSGVVREVLFLR